MKQIEETGLDYFTEMEAIEKILKKQRYPAEAENYLEMIEKGSVQYGWRWVAVKAFCLGVIYGKREERSKRKPH
jgi:hypothetical protein